MRKSTMSVPVLALALLLASCGNRTETAATDGVPSDRDSATGTQAPGALKQGKGVGTVTAIDTVKGSVTLDHGAIADLGWPAMQMSFAATANQLAGLQVGDKVAFDIAWDGKAGSVTSISKTQ